MLVEFTPEQEMFREAVRDFCRREITREYVRTCDAERTPPREVYDKLGELGWLGINIPTEYGGGGGGAVEVAILLEELGKSFLDLAFWGVSSRHVGRLGNRPRRSRGTQARDVAASRRRLDDRVFCSDGT